MLEMLPHLKSVTFSKPPRKFPEILRLKRVKNGLEGFPDTLHLDTLSKYLLKMLKGRHQPLYVSLPNIKSNEMYLCGI